MQAYANTHKTQMFCRILRLPCQTGHRIGTLYRYHAQCIRYKRQREQATEPLTQNDQQQPFSAHVRVSNRKQTCFHKNTTIPKPYNIVVLLIVEPAQYCLSRSRRLHESISVCDLQAKLFNVQFVSNSLIIEAQTVFCCFTKR